MKLNYKIKDPQSRQRIVRDYCENGNPTQAELTYLADYLLYTQDAGQTAIERESENPITTRNRQITHAKRQTSLESIVEALPGGESALQGIITNDPNQILDRKDEISEQDVESIPYIQDTLDMIGKLNKKLDTLSGTKKYNLKKTIIELWRQIYTVRASYHTATQSSSFNADTYYRTQIPEDVYFDDLKMPQSNSALTMLNPQHISLLLVNYDMLFRSCGEDMSSDMRFLLMDLEDLVNETFKDNKMLMDLTRWKIGGYTNEEISRELYKRYGVNHTAQYLSTLWRKRIPKMLADAYRHHLVLWKYGVDPDYPRRKCGHCGKIMLEHPIFFPYSRKSDSYYSICKKCRAVKYKDQKAKRIRSNGNG